MLQRHVRAWTGRAARQLSTMASSAATSNTPMEDAIRTKVNAHSASAPRWNEYNIVSGLTNQFTLSSLPLQITDALEPSRLEIFNDSAKHAHHQAMVGSTSRETHFRLVITSDAFRSKMQPARHRVVYQLLKDEMAQDGGIHALQLRTMTPEEEQRYQERERAANAAEAS